MKRRMKLKPKVIVIVGPTASGKTALSIELAKKANGEYLLFCHHDLLFEEDELGNIIKYLSDIGSSGRLRSYLINCY